MTENMTQLSIDDSFTFSCDRTISCFNECCRDLNQFLTPYDILRLKNRLKLTASDFLKRYTTQHIGPQTGLPIISFKMNPENGKQCPFVTPQGCSVYDDRPASCRAYPLIRAASRSRETGRITEYFMLLREPHCQGFREKKSQTVREWIKSQGLEVYNQMNDELMEIISLKNRTLPGPLEPQERKAFQLACYDLDTFAQKIFEEGLLDKFNLSPSFFDAVRQNDIALLKTALAWLRHTLFGKEMPDENQLIA